MWASGDLAKGPSAAPKFRVEPRYRLEVKWLSAAAMGGASMQQRFEDAPGSLVRNLTHSTLAVFRLAPLPPSPDDGLGDDR